MYTENFVDCAPLMLLFDGSVYFLYTSERLQPFSSL